MLARALVYTAALLMGLLLSSNALADERILSFDAVITVNADNTADVRETIRVRAEAQRILRGIYRDFIVERRPGIRGIQDAPRFEFQSVQRDGQPERSFSRMENGALRLYVGGPAAVIPGEHTYEIHYRASNPVILNADHDELYWNVTGNSWEFPIDAVSARVVLPDGVPRDYVKFEALTGPTGARGTDYTAQVTDGAPAFTSTRGLRPREGFTLVVSWPSGFIRANVERPARAGATPVPTSSLAASSSTTQSPSTTIKFDWAWWRYAVVGLLAFAVLRLLTRPRSGRYSEPNDDDTPWPPSRGHHDGPWQRPSRPFFDSDSSNSGNSSHGSSSSSSGSSSGHSSGGGGGSSGGGGW